MVRVETVAELVAVLQKVSQWQKKGIVSARRVAAELKLSILNLRWTRWLWMFEANLPRVTAPRTDQAWQKDRPCRAHRLRYCRLGAKAVDLAYLTDVTRVWGLRHLPHQQR